MQTDERNFRSTYYEKVGCRSVEEKRSLEILLKDKPLSRIKLKQFCLRFTVPAVYRALLWNLLLGVAPVYADSRKYVISQRLAVYEDLQRALRKLRIVDDRTAQANAFHAMWLLENRKLRSGFNINAGSTFVKITEVLIHISDNDVENYWMAKGFYALTLEIKNDMAKLRELTFSLLEKQEVALYKHFYDNDLLESLPIDQWYESCFAGIIAKTALFRIWDKVCGGSRKIVVFVCVVLFNFLSRRILQHDKLEDVLRDIASVKDNMETADHIVNKSIEMWQQNKDHTEFMIHRKDN